MYIKASATLLLSTLILLAACASNRPDERRGPPEGQHMDPARREAMVSQYITRWDYNNDGSATCDDINVSRSRLFRLLDEDKNEALSSGEYRHAKFEDKSFLFFDFIRVDTNSDGTVSLNELVAVPHSQFMAADKDNDCRISPDEAIAAMRDMQIGGRPEGQGKGDRRGSRDDRTPRRD